MSEEGYEKIKKAVDEVKKLSQNKEEWNLYVSRQRMLMDIESGKAYEHEQGKAEGEKIGTEKVAKEMLKKGMDIELISEITKLSKKEIEKLKD